MVIIWNLTNARPLTDILADFKSGAINTIQANFPNAIVDDYPNSELILYLWAMSHIIVF